MIKLVINDVFPALTQNLLLNKPIVVIVFILITQVVELYVIGFG